MRDEMLTHNRPTVTGAVLVGGRSLRFGSDKALFAVGDRSMARVVADIMFTAHIKDVFVVGDSQVVADALGLSLIADLYPGQGPLGGLVSVMREVSTEILCVLPCDVPGIHTDRIELLVDAISHSDEVDMAVLMTTREHWLCSSWRVSTCLPVLEECFNAGERAIHRAAGALAVQRVVATEEEMININTLQQALEI